MVYDSIMFEVGSLYKNFKENRAQEKDQYYLVIQIIRDFTKCSNECDIAQCLTKRGLCDIEFYNYKHFRFVIPHI
jgi:hypothetical protein